MLRRGEVEGLAGQFMGGGFEGHDLLADFVALAGQRRGVDQDASAFHPPDHLPDGHFEIVVDMAQTAFSGELRVQRLVYAQRDVGILGGVGRGAFDIDLVEADLPGALAAQVFVGDGRQPEVTGAQLAEVVALVRFQHVGLEHGVVSDASQCDAMIGENVLVVLGILQYFFPVDRGKPGFQSRQHLVARQLVGGAGRGMGERDVAGFARGDRQRNADDAGGKGVEAGGFGIERGQFGSFDSGQPGIELWPGQHGFVADGDRPGQCRGYRRGFTCSGVSGRGIQISQPGAEFVTGVEIAQGFDIATGRGQRAGSGQICQIAGDRDQFPAERQEAEVVAQVLADDAAYFTGVGDDFVERAVLLQPLHRCLGAAFLDPGYAVDGVADQRQIINDARRRDTELGCDARLVEQFIAHRVVPAHLRPDQLGEILVAGGNQCFQAVDRGSRGQRADHVVGFDAVDHQQRPAGGPDRGVNGFDLADQIVRHRRAVRLVFRVPVVAEGLALGVEDDGLVVRLVVAFQPA